MLLRRIGRAIKKAVKAIGDVVTSIVSSIVSLVELVLGVFLDAINYIAGIIFAIPGLGRVLKWILNIIQTAVWIIVGALEWLLEQLGISIQKKMRCCVIVLPDENDVSVLDGHPSGISRSDLILSLRADLEDADKIFRDEANVKLVPAVRAGINEDREEIPILFHENKGSTVNSDSFILDVNCDKVLLEDLGLPGVKFGLLRNRYCFANGYRGLIGLGSTITIFVIRRVGQNINIPGGAGNDSSGCSAGFLANYVVVEPFRNSNSTIAHELGHACGLFHSSEIDNLMKIGRTDTKLNNRQRFFVRSSKNVSAL